MTKRSQTQKSSSTNRSRSESRDLSTADQPAQDEGTGGFLARLYRIWTSHMEPAVFIPAAAIIVLFVAFGSLFPGAAYEVFDSVQSWIVRTFGWFYVLTTSALVLVMLYIMSSPLG